LPAGKKLPGGTGKLRDWLWAAHWIRGTTIWSRGVSLRHPLWFLEFSRMIFPHRAWPPPAKHDVVATRGESITFCVFLIGNARF